MMMILCHLVCRNKAKKKEKAAEQQRKIRFRRR